MDNTLIGYLAGIIDGEGTVSLSQTKGWPWPRVVIPNTSEAVINKCQEALDFLGITYTTWSDKGSSRNLSLQRISVGGRQAVNLLLLMQHHIVRQVDRSHEIIKFFDGRYDGLTKRGQPRIRNIGWTSQDKEEWENLRIKYNDTKYIHKK